MLYRRSNVAGGTYFFTVNLADRSPDLLLQNIDTLRQVVREVRIHHPFDIFAMVVLPEHIHAIWQLPEGDRDYPKRWSLIKAVFSRAIPKTERINTA